MDDKTIRIIEKTIDRQLPLIYNDAHFQVIVLNSDNNILQIESAVKAPIHIAVKERIQIYVDDYVLNGYVADINPSHHHLKVIIDEKAESGSRRKYLRVDLLLKAVCTKIELPNGIFSHYEVNVLEDNDMIEPAALLGQKQILFLVDLSGGGLGIKSDIPFDAGTPFKFVFKDIRPIDGVVKNTRIIKNNNTSTYRMGIEFKELSERHREQIIAKVFKIYNKKYKK